MSDIIRFQQEGVAVRGVFAEGSGIVDASLAILLSLEPGLGFFQVNDFTIVNPAAIRCCNRGLDDKLSVRCSDGVEVPFDAEHERAFLAAYTF